MPVRIVDTTLRDGEQSAGIAFKSAQKVQIAKILGSLGVYQIEAGIPAMGGEEKKSIQTIAELGLKSIISSWNRLNVDDIRQSAECGVQLAHICVPTSDIQIVSKLGKTREWVLENLKVCMDFSCENNLAFSIGMEDASRADLSFLALIMAEALKGGARAVRYADTVGIMTRGKIYNSISALRSIPDMNMDIEIHAHNDLGMAVSNSIAAVRAGAGLVDCTVGGIGERAGNCNLIEFVRSARINLNECLDIDIKAVEEAQQEISSKFM